MRFLIVGLGNPGVEYAGTRHNVGFEVLDNLALIKRADAFTSERYASRTEFSHKGKKLTLIKPQTYMNLSGKAVRYWMNEEKVPIDRLLVVTDDLALPYGRMRIKGKGGAGGHNGLQNIIDTLSGQNWARLRFGIGKEFHRGQQSNYVLGKWSAEEQTDLQDLMDRASQGVLDFCSIGLGRTMNNFNN